MRWTVSWLSGRDAAGDGDDSESAESRWPGERLGLPRSGPGSVASLGSRALALLVDIVLAALVAALFTAPDLPRNWSLLAWFAITVVAVSFFGFTPGMAALGIRVIRMDGASMVGPIRAIPRTIMVALIIPAAVTDRDGRGLHDRAIGTIVVRTRRRTLSRGGARLDS